MGQASGGRLRWAGFKQGTAFSPDSRKSLKLLVGSSCSSGVVRLEGTDITLEALLSEGYHVAAAPNLPDAATFTTAPHVLTPTIK